MKRFALSLPFKGDRTYLHGTDMYDGTMAALTKAGCAVDGRVQFRIYRIARNAVDLLAYEAGETVTRPKNAVASLAVGNTAAFLVETGREIENRTDYDDNATDAHATLIDDSIHLSAAPDLTTIEAIVAITRSLHRATLASTDRRWMFTGLDLAGRLTPGSATDCTVTIESNRGMSLTKSAIVTAADGTLGHIYFSLVDA